MIYLLKVGIMFHGYVKLPECILKIFEGPHPHMEISPQVIQVIRPWLTLWLWHSQFAMGRSTIFKNGKPSISMDPGFHGEV